MPLLYSVKDALAYIAAGSYISYGLHLGLYLYLYIIQECTITLHNTPECHAAPSQQTAHSSGVEEHPISNSVVVCSQEYILHYFVASEHQFWCTD